MTNMDRRITYALIAFTWALIAFAAYGTLGGPLP